MINLTTLDEVKGWIQAINTDDDQNIEDRIVEVSARAQQFMNRDMELKSRVELHDGGRSMIFPREVPVITITEIRTSSSLDFGSIGFVVPALDYTLVNNGWDIFHTTFWPGGRFGVQLTYMAGFLDASDTLSLLPADLRKATAKQVAYEFKNRKTIGLETVDLADGTLTKSENMFLPAVASVLKTHRKKQIG